MFAKSLPLRRPRVLAVAPQLRHESGPSFDAASQQVAVVAHWSQRPELSRSVQTLLAEFIEAGYTCALVSSAETTGPLQFTDGRLAESVTVLRRPNVGYDFGSWAAFLAAFEPVRRAPRVILANDSLVGPFDTIAPILAGFDSSGADIWGVTSSDQDCPHLQSYMIGYTDGVLASPALQDFWRGIRVQRTKKGLIRAYEQGLSRVISRNGLSAGAYFPWQSVAQQGQNPTTLGWRRLILSGFPFVKRELVLHPPPELSDAGDVAAVVRQTWGEDVYAWV